MKSKLIQKVLNDSEVRKVKRIKKIASKQAADPFVIWEP